MAALSTVGVLVADDDADIRELVAFKLTSAGYSVDQAEDGEVAWRRFQVEPPAVVVLDIQMPRMTGLEVLRRIRDSRGAYVPVVFLSGRSRASDVEAGLAAGADAYLVKPFSPRELLAVVGELAPLRQAEVEYAGSAV